MYETIKYYHKQSYCLLKYTEAIPKGMSYTSHERLYIVECLATDVSVGQN